MPIRKKPARNRSRVDPSLPINPPVQPVTPTISGGSVILTSENPLVFNASNLKDITLLHGTTLGLVDAATSHQVDDYNIGLKFTDVATVVAGDELNIKPSMTGIRSNRGGILVIGPYTFPA